MKMSSSLWERVKSQEIIASEELDDLLDNFEETNLDAADSARAVIGFIRSQSDNESSFAAEVLIGGDGSETLLQIIVATDASSSGAAALDVIATGLCVKENDDDAPAMPCCTARAKRAMTLIASYWCAHPEAPLLVVPDGQTPKRVLAALKNKPWTTGPMSAAHLAKMRQWAAGDPEAQVGFKVNLQEET